MTHKLTDEQWHAFFLACCERLPPGSEFHYPRLGESWCAFTTFRRLGDDAGYWTHGLPHMNDIGERWINDGGVWGQPFHFHDLAHLIIPKTFGWERYEDGRFVDGGRDTQDIEGLSAALTEKRIEHRLTELVLEIKCY
jgi:hypothetical protein